MFLCGIQADFRLPQVKVSPPPSSSRAETMLTIGSRLLSQPERFCFSSGTESPAQPPGPRPHAGQRLSLSGISQTHQMVAPGLILCREHLFQPSTQPVLILAEQVDQCPGGAGSYTPREENPVSVSGATPVGLGERGGFLQRNQRPDPLLLSSAATLYYEIMSTIWHQERKGLSRLYNLPKLEEEMA